MSVADCGWRIRFGRNAQKACDHALIVRRAAENCDPPFMNVQDGFLTTHTIENILLPEQWRRTVSPCGMVRQLELFKRDADP